MPDADTTTLANLLRDYAGFAQRFASSHEANPELARDLAQDILVAVWRAWPAFRAQCSERTYVARIAQHRVASHIARAVRQPLMAPLSDELQESGPSPEEAAIRQGDRQQLMALVRTLPLAYREVAVLMLEGFTTGEVAETMGLTLNAVAIRATRARALLRALMENAS
jgi:RNA polymerase sigma-70 factor, ECF subfamily